MSVFWKKFTTTIVTALVAGFIGWCISIVQPPPTERIRLAWSNVGEEFAIQDHGKVRVVLTWLEEDGSGTDTQNVADALAKIESIALRRSARTVRASGAGNEWRHEMKTRAREILNAWNADLAIVGRVKKSKEVLNIWLIPNYGDGTLKENTEVYTLENVTLKRQFDDAVQQQLVAVLLTEVARLEPLSDSAADLKDDLTEVIAKIHNLLRYSNVRQDETRAHLHVALGQAHYSLAQWESTETHFRAALDAYNRAESWIQNKGTQMQAVRVSNLIGQLLRRWGDQEMDARRIQDAIELYENSLKMLDTNRDLEESLIIRNNLGNALVDLGKLNQDMEMVVAGIELYRTRSSKI